MAITPVTFRIIVKPDDIMEKDKHLRKAKEIGLIIHRDEQDREQAAVDEGTVVSFGPTAFLEFHTENPLKVGSRVVYARYAGKVIVDPDDDVKYVAVNDEDIIAVITEKEPKNG